jgi:hypothetical protein
MLVNNGEGRTVMAWTLCKVCCVVRERRYAATVRCRETGACAGGREYGGERAREGRKQRK